MSRDLSLVSRVLGHIDRGHPALADLRAWIGKHLALFTNRVEHSGSIQNPVEKMSDEDLQKTINRITQQIGGTSTNGTDD